MTTYVAYVSVSTTNRGRARRAGRSVRYKESSLQAVDLDRQSEHRGPSVVCSWLVSRSRAKAARTWVATPVTIADNADRSSLPAN